MGQLVIRKIDDRRMVRLKARAKARRTSVEAMVRQAIHELAGGGDGDRRALADEVRSLLPATVSGPTGTEIIRWYRDTNGGRDPDVFGC